MDGSRNGLAAPGRPEAEMDMALAHHAFSPEGLKSRRPGRDGEPSWLAALRRRGLEGFLELGFPRRRDEHWRHFRPGDAFQRNYRFEAPPPELLGPRDIAPFLFPGLESYRLVFVNGRFRPRLSEMPGAAGDPGPTSLFASLQEETPARKLGGLVDIDEHSPLALNTYLMQDGLYLRLPRNFELDRPVHVLHLASGKEASAIFPRNLILLEEGSSATVLESYAGLDGGAHLTVAATEIYCEAGSRLDHYRLQREGDSAVHLGWAGASLGRAARYRSREISLGGGRLRRDTQVNLVDPEASCQLDGLYMARGDQHMDHQTRVEHLSPSCRTEELYKGILAGRAEATFGGLILVDQDAQRTDAKQSNRNLLLSEEARVTSLPQLEIYADDVRCSHGSTTGQLDERQVFFLRSRGVGEKEARSMLTFAFAREILERMELDPVRSRLSEELRRRLPKEGEDR